MLFYMHNDSVMASPEEASGLAAGLTFNVVILYEDVPAGQRAMRTIADVAREFGGELELRPQLWRFELLEDPDWYALAMADAVKADMLIISTSAKSGLSVAVESWIKACLEQKRGTSAAVAALFGAADNMDDSDSSRFQFVQHAAHEAGLDFFAPRTGGEGGLDSSLKSIHSRADAITRTLDEILHQPSPRWDVHL